MLKLLLRVVFSSRAYQTPKLKRSLVTGYITFLLANQITDVCANDNNNYT